MFPLNGINSRVTLPITKCVASVQSRDVIRSVDLVLTITFRECRCFTMFFFRVNANVHPLTIYNRILLRPRVVCIVSCCDDSGFLINEKQKRSKETRV